MSNNQTVKPGRGGKRIGAGRKAVDPQVREQVLLDELIFPAVCTAFHAEPGRWNERILTFELSTVQIRDAYGHDGLREWKSYFTAVRKGGKNRAGEGYATLWRFNNAKYGLVLKLVRALGHDIKDLPNPGFPPRAMLERLEAFQAKQEARKAKDRAERVQHLQAAAVKDHDWHKLAEALQ